MRHTFSVYAVLVLGLGSMFTSSYHVQNFSVNTAICGKTSMQSHKCLQKSVYILFWKLITITSASSGVVMILVTIMSFIHLIQVCVEKTHTPLAVEPNVKSGSCVTVCDLEGNIKPKQWEKEITIWSIYVPPPMFPAPKFDKLLPGVTERGQQTIILQGKKTLTCKNIFVVPGNGRVVWAFFI